MTIQAYKNNQINTMKITDFTALLLAKASSHVKKSIEAMEQKDVEKQFFFSNIACDILQGLSKYVMSVNPEQAKVAQVLKGYYSDMIVLITRMNVKCDIKTAQAIVFSLDQISEMWRDISRQMDTTMMYPAIIEQRQMQNLMCSA
ncbi:MAG: flagellar protein FliS [Janthinobacterium lividum]